MRISSKAKKEAEGEIQAEKRWRLKKGISHSGDQHSAWQHTAARVGNPAASAYKLALTFLQMYFVLVILVCFYSAVLSERRYAAQKLY